MASMKNEDEEGSLSIAETREIEQAFNDVKIATGEFAKTFEGSEEQGKLGEGSKSSATRKSPEPNKQHEYDLSDDDLPRKTESLSLSNESSKISEEHEQALDKILQLLQSRDDTTKFMGLALLRGALKMIDNEDKQASFAAIAPGCWDAIPSTFLDRLFNQFTKMTEGNTDAKAMFELAVGITHAFVCMLSVSKRRRFITLLPVNMSKELTASWLKRTRFMVAALHRPSEKELCEPIIQILQVFCESSEGASVLLGINDWSPLFRLTAEDERPLSIFATTYHTLAKTKRGHELVPQSVLKKSFNKNINQAIPLFLEIDRPEVLWELLNQGIIAINKPAEIVSPLSVPIADSNGTREQKNPPSWFPKIIRQLRRSPYIERNKREVRTQAAMLASTLSTTYHPVPLAQSLFIPYSESENKAGEKPETFDFVVMLTSEISKSVFDYDQVPKESHRWINETTRLQACYDVLTAFVGFLVGREHVGSPDIPVKPLLPPDLLLELRKLISELMQVTILTIRERFGPPGTSIKLRDPIEEAKWEFPWDMAHAVTCAQLRALALWLRDDDGERLRKEAVAIMDVLLQLVEKGRLLWVGDQIMICLEAICGTSNGAKNFLTLGGWQTVAEELHDIVKQPSAMVFLDEFRGEQMVMVLSTVVHQTGANPPKSMTMKVLQTVAAMEQDTTRRSRLQLALLSLAGLLLSKTSLAQRKQYAKVGERILFKASALYHLGGSTKKDFYEIMMRLTDVVTIPGISI